MGYVNSNPADDENICTDDTQRWNDTVKRLYKELDDAEQAYMALYNDNAKLKQELADANLIIEVLMNTKGQ